MIFTIDIGDAYTKIMNRSGPYNSFIESSIIPVCTYNMEIFGSEAYSMKNSKNKLIFFTSLIGKKYTDILKDDFYKDIYKKNKIIWHDNQIAFECTDYIFTLKEIVKQYVTYILDLLPVTTSKVYLITHHQEFFETLKNDKKYEIIYVNNCEYRFKNVLYPKIKKMEEYYMNKYGLETCDLFSEMENILKTEEYVLTINENFIHKVNKKLLLRKLNIENEEYDIYINCTDVLNNNKLVEYDKTVNEKKEVTRSIGISTIGDIFVPIISRGNKYPIKKEFDFLNGDDNKEIDIEIYIGENKFCQENELIKKMILKFQNMVKRGSTKIKITMEILDNLDLVINAVSNEVVQSGIINIKENLEKEEQITIESELKKIIDSERVSPLLESLELKYLVDFYKNQVHGPGSDKIEYLNCAEYIINNYEQYSQMDIELFTKEFKIKMDEKLEEKK